LRKKTGCLLFLTLLLVPASRAQHEIAPAVSALQNFAVGGTVIQASSGEPVVAALVLISPVNRSDQVQSVFTDTSGRFLFQGIAAGKYRLRATRKGYPAQDFEEHSPFFTAIAVGPDKDTGNLIFRLKPEGSIAGRVTDDEGDPVRGAKVMLFTSSTNTGERIIRSLAQTVADDQGTYSFAHLSTGTYFLAVLATPWYARHSPQSGGARANPGDQASNALLDVAYPVTYYQQATEPEGADPIALSYGDRFTADISLRAVPAVHLRLRSDADVSFGSDAPTLTQTLLGGVEVPIDSQTAAVGPNQQDLFEMAPGRYDLHYDTTIDTGEEPTYQPDAGPRHQVIDTGSKSEVNAAQGAVLATIAGSVKFEGGGVPREAHLWLRKISSAQEFETPVSSGEIEPIEISTGRYELKLESSEGFVLQNILSTRSRASGQILEIDSSGQVQLTLTAAKGNGRLDGVVMCNNKPVAGAMVVLVPQQDPENSMQLFRREQSSTDGTFTISAILPGRYTALAIENGWDLEWANLAALKPYLLYGQNVQIDQNAKADISLMCSSKSQYNHNP